MSNVSQVLSDDVDLPRRLAARAFMIESALHEMSVLAADVDDELAELLRRAQGAALAAMIRHRSAWKSSRATRAAA